MPLTSGSRLDEWVIDDLLGAGRDGTVYRAHESGNPRHIVAIKVYPAADPRLRREVEVIHSLAHPNIVAVHQARFDGPFPYLVLDRIDGPTLAHWMSEGPMATAQAETLFREALAAILYLHERGLYHRDVKPQNFLFDRVRGRLVLVDFGHVHGRNTTFVTSPEMVFASLRYSPPECGTGAEDDARRDIYALGVILFELLTATRAYNVDASVPLLERLQAIRAAQREGPLDPGPPLPQRLREVVRGATAPNPADRFASASAMLQQLDLDPDAITPRRAPPRVARPPHPWRVAFQRWWDR